MMRNEILLTTAKVAITAAAGGTPRRLRIVGYSGGPMVVAGFGEIVVDLAGLTLPETLPVLSDHKNELTSVIGNGTPTIEAGKLIVLATLASSPAAEGVLQLMASGVAIQASLGAVPKQRQTLKANESITVNGQQVTAGPQGLTSSRKAYCEKSASHLLARMQLLL